jgi:type IV pilus assembly protein PilN
MQVIDQLERSRAEIVHLFDQLVRTLPDGVYLTLIKQNDRRIQLKGVAQSSTRVSNYMRNIDASDWMTEPSLAILETKGSGDAGSDFTLNAMQKNPMATAEAAEKAPARKKPASGAARGGSR